MRLESIATPGLLRLCAVLLVGCNAIAGIGAPVLEGADAGEVQPTPDGGNTLPDANGLPVPDGGPGEDGGATVDASDADILDANVPDTFTPPPAVAGKPGFDIVAGGVSGKSAGFRLVASVGESPGGNNVGTSTNYVLKAGVIAVTQPN